MHRTKAGSRASISAWTGTLIQPWAAHKSFVHKDDDEEGSGQGSDHSEAPDKSAEHHGGFKGERRSNETHWSRGGPESRLYGKGKTASAHPERQPTRPDRQPVVTQADGFAEREAAKALLKGASQRAGKQISVGADKGYGAAEFVQA